MLLTIDQTTLAAGLSAVGRAVAPRSTLPVLNNVLLEASETGLKLSATNLEIGITTSRAADVTTHGGITVPYRVFADMAGTLPDEQVMLETDDAKCTLAVKCGATHFDLKGIDAGEFPPMLPTVNEGTTFTGEQLKRAISRVAFAASTDQARPVRQGVQLRWKGGFLSFAATDGFRIAVIETGSDAPDGTAIIPAAALKEVNRLAQPKETVYLRLPENRGQAQFIGSDWALTCQLIDGNFPDYKVLLPKSYKTTVTANTAALLSAIRRAEIIARMGNGVVKLEIAGGRIVVSATSEETGSNESAVDATIDGVDSQVIAFNAKFIQEALEVAGGERVELRINDGQSPAKVTAVDDPLWFTVCMPMHLG